MPETDPRPSDGPPTGGRRGAVGSETASTVVISKRLLALNAASAVAYQLLSLTVLFWLQRHLLAGVSTDEYAVYAVLMTLMMAAPVLTAVLGAGLSRSVLAAYARGDRDRVVRLVSTLLPLCAVAALLLAAVGTASALWIDQLLPIGVELERRAPAAAAQLRQETRVMAALLFGLAALQTATVPFQLGLTLRQKFVWRHAVQLAAEVLRISTMLALLFGVGTKVLWVVVAGVPATLFSIVTSCWLSRRLVPELCFERARFTPALIRPVLALGGWTFGARAATSVREVLGVLMLNQPTWAGANAVADYRLAKIVDNQLRRLVLAVVPVAQPQLTALAATGQRDRLQRTYLRLFRYGAWVLLAVATPLVVFHRPLYRLYLDAERYALHQAAAVAMAVLLARFAVAFARPAAMAVALATARMRAMALASIALELVTLALAYLLVVVQGRGAVGLALAVTAPTLLFGGWLYWGLGLRIAAVPAAVWARQALLPGVVPALVAAPVWGALCAAVAIDSWLTLAACVALGCAVYTAVAARLLRPGERTELRALGRRLLLRGGG